MPRQVARGLGESALREIRGRCRCRKAHLVADAHRDHVAREPLARPNSGIEALGDNVDKRAVDRNVEADLGILRKKACNDRGENEIGGRRGNGHTERARRLGAKIVHRFERCLIVVEHWSEPLQEPLAGRGRGD